MRKKLTKVLILCLAFALVFTACSGSSKPAEPEKKAEAPAEQKAPEQKKEEAKPVKLSVTHNWFGSDAHSAWTKWAFEDFQKKYPNITLDINEVPSDKYRQKVRADFMANSATDTVLWYSGAECYDYVKQNLLMDITPVLGSAKDDFMAGMLQNMTFDSKLYGLPLSQNFFALYLNKDIYSKYNFQYPKTYEELLEQVKKFKADGLVPIMMPGQNHPAIAAHFLSFISNQTTKPGDFEKASYAEDGKSYKDGGFMKAAEIAAELQKAGAFDPNIDGIPMASVEDMFSKGKGAMYFIGIWRIGALPKEMRDKMHPILMPAVKGFTESPNIATAQTEMGWIVNAQSGKDKAKANAVATWVKYFASKEVSQAHAELTDTIIPLQNNVDLAKASYAVKQSVELVKNGESRPFLRYYQSPAQGGAHNEVGWGLINGRITPAEAMDKLVKVPANKR